MSEISGAFENGINTLVGELYRDNPKFKISKDADKISGAVLEKLRGESTEALENFGKLIDLHTGELRSCVERGKENARKVGSYSGAGAGGLGFLLGLKFLPAIEPIKNALASGFYHSYTKLNKLLHNYNTIDPDMCNRAGDLITRGLEGLAIGIVAYGFISGVAKELYLEFRGPVEEQHYLTFSGYIKRHINHILKEKYSKGVT